MGQRSGSVRITEVVGVVIVIVIRHVIIGADIILFVQIFVQAGCSLFCILAFAMRWLRLRLTAHILRRWGCAGLFA